MFVYSSGGGEGTGAIGATIQTDTDCVSTWWTDGEWRRTKTALGSTLELLFESISSIESQLEEDERTWNECKSRVDWMMMVSDTRFTR